MAVTTPLKPQGALKAPLDGVCSCQVFATQVPAQQCTSDASRNGFLAFLVKTRFGMHLENAFPAFLMKTRFVMHFQSPCNMMLLFCLPKCVLKRLLAFAISWRMHMTAS